MTVLVAGEYGKVLRINAGYDLSGATAFALTVTRPDASTFSAGTAQITVGAATIQAKVERPDGSVVQKTFIAGEYVEYTLTNGDIPIKGRYHARLQADFGAAQRLRSIDKVFRVFG